MSSISAVLCEPCERVAPAARVHRCVARPPVIAGLLLAGCAPLLYRFAAEQWARPQYQFFPLMIIAAAYIAWQRLIEAAATDLQPGARPAVRCLLGGATILLAGSVVLWSGRGAAMALWLAMAGVASSIGGRKLLRALAPAGFLLALIIGPPIGMEEQALQHLREVAVRVSSSVLLLMGIPHLMTGTVVEVAGHRLLVAEACSGINSLMAVLGFTLVLGFVRRHSRLRIGTLTVLAAVFALWANVVRISAAVWCCTTWNIDLLSGSAHEWASIMLFGVCLLLVLSADRLLGLLVLAPEDRLVPIQEMDLPQARRPATERVNIFKITLPGEAWAFAAVFVVLGVAQISLAELQGGLSRSFSSPFTSHLPLNAALVLPPELVGWRRAEANEKHIAQLEIEGKRSQAWVFRRDGLGVVVAMDFPFAGFHDLTVCYRNAGWMLDSQTTKRDPEPSPGGPFVQAHMTRPKEHGYCWFGAVDEQGAWVEPPSDRLAGRLRQRLGHVGRTVWNAPTYQVQVWAQSNEPLSEAQERDLQTLYLAARQALAAQLAEYLKASPRPEFAVKCTQGEAY